MTFKNELRWLVLIAVVAIGIFANSIGGEFVYDDRRQIVANALIQNPSLYGKALSNDVWAFKGDGTISASNYWRPTFTAWCIVNFQLFGLDPAGWHILNLLLQIGVCLIAFLLLRRWGASALVAFAITLIFAVHPVHTESVAWISGVPDLLFGLAFLASLWFAENAADKDQASRRTLNLALAVLCYALALGAKEVAFLCFPIYYLIFARDRGEGTATLDKAAIWRGSLPFAALAAVYFVVRWMILGQLSRPAEGAASLLGTVLSAPGVFVFYLRQLVFPYWMGVNYSVRPLVNVDIMTFFVPLAISIATLVGLWLLAKRSFIQRLGLAIFLLPMLSVFNIRAFLPEQIVHDRYLYLPLLGFLMVVVPFLAAWFRKTFAENGEKLLLALVLIISALLGLKTFFYNRVWLDELSLWRHAVTIDPRSASNWSALGSELSERQQTQEALRAYNISIQLRPAPIALIGRAQNLIGTGNLDDGIKDLTQVTAIDLNSIDLYTLYQAYEGLALAYQQKNEFENAEKVLVEGRNRLPIYRAALTEKLAVILYLQNRKPDALRELEGVKDQARAELLPASKSVFLRLGMLYAELGRADEARVSLREYLSQTATVHDKETPSERKQAEEILRGLR